MSHNRTGLANASPERPPARPIRTFRTFRISSSQSLGVQVGFWIGTLIGSVVGPDLPLRRRGEAT